MKINVKKKNSTLEVNLKLDKHCSEVGKEVPIQVVTTRSLRSYLVGEGHNPGDILSPPVPDTNKVSNAEYDLRFNLDSVWVFEDLDAKNKPVEIPNQPQKTKPTVEPLKSKPTTQKTKKQNKNKK